MIHTPNVRESWDDFRYAAYVVSVSMYASSMEEEMYKNGCMYA